MSEVKTPKVKITKIVVRPVYGAMVHQLTAQLIDRPTEFDEVDFWLQAQLDAGKLEKVI